MNPIDRKLVRRWQGVKDRHDRYAFYTEHIVPEIVRLLQQRVEERQRAGAVPRYRNLTLILPHDANPFFIVMRVIRPETVTVLYTADKAHLLEKRVRPALESECGPGGAEFVELDGINHRENMRIIRDVLRRNRRAYRSVLCDVTGGKKILATLIGIAAHAQRLDLCYLDAQGYIDGNVPDPGEEVLYIQRFGELDPTEIQLLPENRLKIGFYDDGSPHVTYDLFLGDESLKFRQKPLSASEARALAEGLAVKCDTLDARIHLDRPDCGDDLMGLASIIRSCLVPRKLDRVLQEMKGAPMKLILDEEVSGIPWEIALSVLYGIALPVARIPHKDEEFDPGDRGARAPRGGVLVVTGSSEGIPSFRDTVAGVHALCEGQDFRAHAAASAAELRLFLAEHAGRYRVLVYFGHARFDADQESTGWICEDGSVFDIRHLEVLYHNAPDIVIANACQSARLSPFTKNSFAYAALRAGCETYIGTNWLLEAGRSTAFLAAFTDELLAHKAVPSAAFAAAMDALRARYGEGDISLYNYVYYGK